MTTKTFGFTAGAQPFVVPDGVTSIVASLKGAGGGGKGGYGGAGGVANGTLTVTPGETLQINVGGVGSDGATGYQSGAGNGGWNGGKNGGNNGSSNYTGSPLLAGSGGGGATDIRRAGTALSNRILIAGGGGGASGGPNGTNPWAKGGDSGTAGSSGGTVHDGKGGGGATGSAGGSGGAGGQGSTSGSSVASGTAGSAGDGGPGANVSAANTWGGGGGGGGAYGGGGGGGGYYNGTGTGAGGGGGGGGSNAAASGVTNATGSANGGAAGGSSGSVTLTYNIPYGAPTLSTPQDNATPNATATIPFTWTNGTPGETYDTINSVDIQFVDTVTGATTTQNISGAATSYTAAANKFTASHEYNWRVRANSSSTGAGFWSDYRSFTPTVNQITAPTLQAPADGSTPDGTQAIVFHWANGQTSQNNDSIASTDIQFIQNYQVVKTVNLTGAPTSYTLAANGLPANQATTWQVRNNGSASGPGAFSNTQTFTPTQTYYAPSAPTLTSPASGATVDAAQPITLTAVYNSNDNSNQSAYALRVKVDSGSYRYWDASAKTLTATSPVWNSLPAPVQPGATLTVTLPAGTVTNGHTIAWSEASQSASGGQLLNGPFATDRTFTTAPGPSVVVTDPTGTVAQSKPATQWAPTITNGVQTAYEVVWESGSFGVSPGQGNQITATGVVSSAATSATPAAVLPANVNLRTFVRITQTGGAQSGWAYRDFRTTAPAPNVPNLTVGPSFAPTGLPVAAFTVAGSDSNPSQTAFEVQRSDDNGVSWIDVRGAAQLAPDPTTDTATGIDVGVPFGGAPLYRARTLDTSGTGAASDWSPLVPTAVYADTPWLIDPLDPDSAIAVDWTPPADQTYGIDQDVTDTLGSSEPVVESDVRQLGAGSYQWITHTPTERAALVALLNRGSTLLQRDRNEEEFAGEATFFVAVGPITVARVGQNLPVRLVSTAWQERSRPVVSSGNASGGSGGTGGGSGGGTETVQVTNPGNQTANAGTAIPTLQIQATDSAGNPISFTVDTLPPGLSMSTSGAITGTPTTAGSTTSTVTVKSSTNVTASTTFTWTVNTAETVTVTNPGAQSKNKGSAVNIPLTASDSANKTLTWSSTTLPAGLSINTSTGTISGTPTVVGTYYVTVTASSGTASGTARFAINLNETSTSAQPVNPGTQNNKVGDVINWQVGAYTGLYIAQTPTGIQVGGRVFQGTLTQAGSFTTIVQSDTAAEQISFTWNVTA